jgi:PAS domain S-box-containing protein
MAKELYLSGNERVMADDEVIVSKTNLKGHITYGNDVFCNIADYTAREVIGAPHSILRHPEMPRCIFKLLWERIESGKEIFAYVVNRGKHGDHYWVLAHVTPSFDATGTITGYHSNRRKPTASAVKAIKELYAILLAEEKKAVDRKTGLNNSYQLLSDILDDKGVDYGEFVLAL